jgi:hypothetical protein
VVEDQKGIMRWTGIEVLHKVGEVPEGKERELNRAGREKVT